MKSTCDEYNYTTFSILDKSMLTLTRRALILTGADAFCVTSILVGLLLLDSGCRPISLLRRVLVVIEGSTLCLLSYYVFDHYGQDASQVSKAMMRAVGAFVRILAATTLASSMNGLSEDHLNVGTCSAAVNFTDSRFQLHNSGRFFPRGREAPLERRRTVI